MVEIGSIIAARVTEIVPYGLWLQYQEEKVLVLITDLSWKVPVRHPSEITSVGQTLNVKVLRYNHEKQVYRASLKAVSSEGNPYCKLAELEPGAILRGQVSFVTKHEFEITLPDHVRGQLLRSQLQRELALGEEVDVVVAGLNIDEGRLTLHPSPGKSRFLRSG